MSLKSSSTGAAAAALGLRPRLAPVGFSASGVVFLLGLTSGTAFAAAFSTALALLAGVCLLETFVSGFDADLTTGLAAGLTTTLATGFFVAGGATLAEPLAGTDFLEAGTELTFLAVATGFKVVFATGLAAGLITDFAVDLTGALGATLATVLACVLTLAELALPLALAAGLTAGLALTLAVTFVTALATGLADFLTPEGACALTGFFGF